jgi:hypothetical protein
MKEIIKHNFLPVNKYSIEILSTAECIHQFYFYGARQELYDKVDELQEKGNIILKIKEELI